MKRARFSDEQIVRILQEADRSPIAEVAKRHGASMPIIMQRGRWSKTDTIMRYLEHSSYSG